MSPAPEPSELPSSCQRTAGSSSLGRGALVSEACRMPPTARVRRCRRPRWWRQLRRRCRLRGRRLEGSLAGWHPSWPRRVSLSRHRHPCWRNPRGRRHQGWDPCRRLR